MKDRLADEFLPPQGETEQEFVHVHCPLCPPDCDGGNASLEHAYKVLLDEHPPNARMVLTHAVVAGWEIQVADDRCCVIVSPDGKHRQVLSGRRDFNTRDTLRLKKLIEASADPVRRATVVGAVRQGVDPEAWLGAKDDYLDGMFRRLQVRITAFESEPGESKADRERRLRRGRAAEMERRLAERRKDEPVTTEETRTIVSTRPYLAHAGVGSATTPGRRYESDTTLERVWSDGTVDYCCPEEGCDYAADTPYSVRNHWRAHGKESQFAERRTNGTILDPGYTAPLGAYTPRSNRVEALAAELLALTADDSLTPEELAKKTAEAALRWVHEQSNKGTGLAAEREAMTAEEIVARIRTLIDQGAYVRQRQELDQAQLRVLELEEQLQAKAEEVHEARATTKRVIEARALADELFQQEIAKIPHDIEEA